MSSSESRGGNCCETTPVRCDHHGNKHARPLAVVSTISPMLMKSSLPKKVPPGYEAAPEVIASPATLQEACVLIDWGLLMINNCWDSMIIQSPAHHSRRRLGEYRGNEGRTERKGQAIRMTTFPAAFVIFSNGSKCLNYLELWFWSQFFFALILRFIANTTATSPSFLCTVVVYATSLHNYRPEK